MVSLQQIFLYFNIPTHLKYIATLPCEIRISENWRQCEICIVIYDKSQDRTAKHLSCEGLLNDKFISQPAGKRIFKIGEHLVNLQARWLIVSYVPFALDFCSQRCRTLSKITCVRWTETVTDCCYVNRRINMRLLSTHIKLLWTSFDFLSDRLMLSVSNQLLIMYGI